MEFKKTTGITVYNRDYFFSECDGYVQFSNSRGKVLGKRLKKIFELANVKPDMNILDLGCGRGELVLHSALKRAHAWGIDISGDAINICDNTLAFWKKEYPWIDRFARFRCEDVCQLNFSDSSFDIVFLSDMVEHLKPVILKKTLEAVNRVMKSNGKLLIHTSPNRYYIPVTGRVFSLISRILYIMDIKKKSRYVIPWNIRTVLPRGLKTDIHINEQSSFSLKRVLKKTGFCVEKIWFELNPHYIDALYPDQRGFQIINSLKKLIPVKHLFYADLYCIAKLY